MPSDETLAAQVLVFLTQRCTEEPREASRSRETDVAGERSLAGRNARWSAIPPSFSTGSER